MRSVLIVAAVYVAVLSSAAVAAPGPVHAADELPEGAGKTILQASCTACHDLTEVTKFKGFYTRDDWRDIVKTMVAYGAKVEPKDVDVLVDYLDKYLGKKP